MFCVRGLGVVSEPTGVVVFWGVYVIPSGSSDGDRSTLEQPNNNKTVNKRKR
jgi:hypothetical protein